MTSFRESGIQSCNSLLPSSEKATFCHKTANIVPVPIHRLDAILRRVPPGYSFYYLKIDTEGADFMILQGGSDYIDKFEFVSIECRKNANSGNRIGECRQDETISYMYRKGFIYNWCDDTDCSFYKNENELKTVQELFWSAHSGKVEAKYCKGPKAKEFFQNHKRKPKKPKPSPKENVPDATVAAA